MHALEVIIIRNAEAAGREAGHAANDGDNDKLVAISSGFPRGTIGPGYLKQVAERLAFLCGYARGRKEG